jgi:hypothetical protein
MPHQGPDATSRSAAMRANHRGAANTNPEAARTRSPHWLTSSIDASARREKRGDASASASEVVYETALANELPDFESIGIDLFNTT